MTLVTTAHAARALGVSRQAVDQALARNAEPPQPSTDVTDRRMYDLDEIITWWQNRQAGHIREMRLPRLDSGPSAQLSIRVRSSEYAFVKSLAEPGQTVAAVSRILLLEAIAARKAASGPPKP